MPDHDEAQQIAVPKFASFRPKAAPTACAQREKGREKDYIRHSDRHRDRHRDRDREGRSKRDDDGRHRSQSRRDRHRDRSREKVRSRDRDPGGEREKDRARDKERPTEKNSNHDIDGKPRDRSPHRHSRSHAIHLPTPPKSTIPQITNSDVFTIDTKGDPLIHHLGLDRYRIPSFGREPRRYLLGTSARLIIHRNGPREQFSLLKSGEFFGPPPLRNKKLTYGMTRALKVETGTEEMGEIIFVGSRKRKRVDYSDDKEEDRRRSDFRSIEGKAKPKYYSDSETSDDDSDMSMADASEIPLPQALFAPKDPASPSQRSITLTRRVKETPSDISAWISLIDLQDQVLAEFTPSVAQLRSTAEIKLSIITKALKNATNDNDIETLLLRQMSATRHIHSPETTRRKWAEIASGDHGSRFALWIARVEYEMTEPREFRIDTVKGLSTDRLAAISEKANKYNGVVAEDLWREAVYVFLRMTRFLQEVGYRELAVASWQAFLELNFWTPEFPEETEHGTIHEAFEGFWEAEVPRVGEDGALGWRHFVENNGRIEPPHPVEINPEDFLYDSSQDVYRAWTSRELKYAERSRMPARTLDDGTGEDPFRMVMAADLEGLLVYLPREVVPLLQEQIIDSLLIFGHLPPCFGSSEWVKRAQHDVFLTPVLPILDHVSTKLPHQDWFSSMSLPPGIVPEYSWQISRALFSTTPSAPSSPVPPHWLLTTLSHLSTVSKLSTLPNLSGYILTLTAQISSPESLLSTARTHLKAAGQNTGLYHLYASLEIAIENSEMASKVLATSATIPSATPSKPPVTDVVLGWTWLEAVRNSNASALTRLISSVDRSPVVDGEEVSGTRILRCKKVLASSLELALGLGDFEGFTVVAKCAVFLSYLSDGAPSEPQNASQGNISAALDLLWTHSSSLCPESSPTPSRRSHQEQLLTFGASLLQLYASRGPHQRTFLHGHLTRFLTLFPQNIFMIDLLSYFNSTTLLRPIFHATAATLLLSSPADCPLNRLAVLSHELHRGTIHTAIAEVERAISVEQGGGYCAALWRVFVRLQGEQTGKKNAMDAYWRAVGRCPWNRDLAVEGLAVIGDRRGKREVGDERMAIESLTTKGLRLHMDFEDFEKLSR